MNPAASHTDDRSFRTILESLDQRTGAIEQHLRDLNGSVTNLKEWRIAREAADTARIDMLARLEAERERHAEAETAARGEQTTVRLARWQVIGGLVATLAAVVLAAWLSAHPFS